MARTREYLVHDEFVHDPTTGEVQLRENNLHNLGLLSRHVVEEDEIPDNIIRSVN